MGQHLNIDSDEAFKKLIGGYNLSPTEPCPNCGSKDKCFTQSRHCIPKGSPDYTIDKLSNGYSLMLNEQWMKDDHTRTTVTCDGCRAHNFYDAPVPKGRKAWAICAW